MTKHHPVNIDAHLTLLLKFNDKSLTLLMAINTVDMFTEIRKITLYQHILIFKV